MKRRSLIAVALIALLVLGSFVATLPWMIRHYLQAQRRHWKDDAIPAIANLAENKSWREKEIGVLTKMTENEHVIEKGWLTDNLILMENGEWLVYRSHCSKAKPHTVEDIFLAKGSDGKWYYSTFHFCVGMVALRGEQETQPPSLAMFVHEYNLRQFDGRSDVCLQKTATFPASWTEKTNNNQQRTP
jgi:hypothetical protein